MAAQQQSPFVAVSRAGLTLAAALGLARVLAGGSWVGAIVLAAVVPGLIFALAHHRRWHPLAAPALSIVVGTWLAVLVDDPSETLAGIPGPAALSQFGHDLARAPDTLRSATVPVDPVGAALLLSFVAVFVAAAATEIIAAAGSTRRSAPSARASRCTSRSRRSVRAAGHRPRRATRSSPSRTSCRSSTPT